MFGGVGTVVLALIWNSDTIWVSETDRTAQQVEILKSIAILHHTNPLTVLSRYGRTRVS